MSVTEAPWVVPAPHASRGAVAGHPVAGRVGADVVVLGSHGHGWLQRVLLGSVSHHVLQHAPCPVLVMRLEDTVAG